MDIKCAVICVAAVACCAQAWADVPKEVGDKIVNLPSVQFKSKMSLESAIKNRRSVRSYAKSPVPLEDVSQLLWAAQGITEPTHGLRTAPSAHASYPLQVYLIAGNVKGLSAGVYRYIPKGHQLEVVSIGDVREKVGKQPQMTSAPVLIAYTADRRILNKFGDKGVAFGGIEVGHSAQNVLLEEVALGLVGVGMAGYDEQGLRDVLRVGPDEIPMYILSAGKKP